MQRMAPSRGYAPAAAWARSSLLATKAACVIGRPTPSPLSVAKPRDLTLRVAVTEAPAGTSEPEVEEVQGSCSQVAQEREAALNLPTSATSGSSAQSLATRIRPFRPLFLMIYLGLSSLAAAIGYWTHPQLLKMVAEIWNIKPSVDDFESSFFGLLSIIYSVFAAQTFLFLFERQINIVQELYGEVFALELLVQQTFLVCHCPELKSAMASAVRLYLKEEVYTPEDMQSPFLKDSSYMIILKTLTLMKGQGVIVTSMAESCKQLADAQSRRSAMAAQIVPQVHWVFMHGMELIFVLTFLIFDASDLDMTASPIVVPEERRLFFGALFGLLALTTQVLKDLDDPLSGIYTFRAALDDRTEYLEGLLNDLENMPANYVPPTVESLEILGLIDSHRQAQQLQIVVPGESSCGSPLPSPSSSTTSSSSAPPSPTLLRVPRTGGRRRRGRSQPKGVRWVKPT